MNDLSADGEACRQLMELDVQLQRTEGGQTDRQEAEMEQHTLLLPLMCGEQTRQLTCVFVSVCVRLVTWGSCGLGGRADHLLFGRTVV